MSTISAVIVAALTDPEQIGTTPIMMLWVLPLAAAIAVVYKATKVPKVTARSFIKETAALFGSIVAFMFVSMVVLFLLAWLITQ
ncbi:MAG TPA: hypothetical protein VMX13_17345 [Sedimentisphaerales bacterium]|nr:hypothetical protein [Sedimentisphaerales bacterium]